MRYLLLFSFIVFVINSIQAQTNLNIQFQADLPSICTELTLTMKHDTESRPYLYVANKEAGLKIYDISILTAPNLVATVPTSEYLGMEVINLTQSGNYVYLAVGNIWATDSSGMVIVDVQNPLLPVVTDFYFLPASTHGSGIVQVEGDYAYLGAMQDGLIVLNVADKNNISFVSQFVPDINFPIVSPSNPDIYNLRGMEVRNDTIFACYDGGGVRVIDVTNKAIPIEVGHYCNPTMYTPLDHPKAYNNIVLRDTLAYLAVDYCGVEVLNISDPANIQLIGWWNPYGCPDNNWFTSPVHANEIHLDTNCNVLFVSTGKSDMYALDVSTPTAPDSTDFYGGITNGIGTWGVNIFENQIYLSYICVPWPSIPFASNWTGVKILTYTNCTNGIEENKSGKFSISPNPTNDQITISLMQEEFKNQEIEIEVTDVSGQVLDRLKFYGLSENITFSLVDYQVGIYYLKLKVGGKAEFFKIIKE